MSTLPKTIRCKGANLRIPGTTSLKTTDAALDLNAGTLRFGYEPETTQQAAFAASLLFAILICIFANGIVGGFGMVLLYFLIYSILAGISVRNIEFDLVNENLWIDKKAGKFGFQVSKHGKKFFIGFRAKAGLIELIEPLCRSTQNHPIQHQSDFIYPVTALICAVLLGAAKQMFF